MPKPRRPMRARSIQPDKFGHEGRLEDELPAERRVSLYLSIARKMRAYPEARGVRHAAVKQAWAARNEKHTGK